MKTRSVMAGRPFSSSMLTSASPTPNSVMAVAMSMPGLARMVSAAALTAFWSRGVKARRACCTQNPLDVPDTVLGQLGNRVQHALRAFTPRDHIRILVL
jgi:hypothetical protein